MFDVLFRTVQWWCARNWRSDKVGCGWPRRRVPPQKRNRQDWMSSPVDSLLCVLVLGMPVTHKIHQTLWYFETTRLKFSFCKDRSLPYAFLQRTNLTGMRGASLFFRKIITQRIVVCSLERRTPNAIGVFSNCRDFVACKYYGLFMVVQRDWRQTCVWMSATLQRWILALHYMKHEQLAFEATWLHHHGCSRHSGVHGCAHYGVGMSIIPMFITHAKLAACIPTDIIWCVMAAPPWLWAQPMHAHVVAAIGWLR